MNSLFPAQGGYPQNYMVDQQQLHISELNFDKFSHTFIETSKCLFQFTLGDNIMDQRSGDGRFGGRLKIIALNSGSYSLLEF